MSILEILGFSAAVMIGVSLGLIGSGGSILTVPIMVYLIGVSPVMATAYSLLVVGATSLVGAIHNIQRGFVNIRAAIIFSIPSFISVFITRRFIMPMLPDHVGNIGSLVLTKDLLIMLIFSILMVVTSISMIRHGRVQESDKHEAIKFNYPMIFLEGAVIGVITGFVGAGGGFLIIPALVVFSKLPMRIAVGTSLLIIAIKSLIGFSGDLYSAATMNWTMLIMFTVLAVIGIFIGARLSVKIPGQRLKPVFGWFVLVMGIYIVVKELLKAQYI